MTKIWRRSTRIIVTYCMHSSSGTTDRSTQLERFRDALRASTDLGLPRFDGHLRIAPEDARRSPL